MAPCWVAVEWGTQVCLNTVTAVILTKHVHVFSPALAGLTPELENWHSLCSGIDQALSGSTRAVCQAVGSKQLRCATLHISMPGHSNLHRI